jgi:hypothetical protein
MGFRDALLRALRARAEVLLDEKLSLTADPNVDEIVEETLRQARTVFSLDEDLTELRARLRSFVDDSLRKRS